MKKLAGFLLCALLLTNLSSGQSNARIWYFGDGAGIDFNVVPPKALTNSSLSTPEGCASVADSTGALLFYSDGVTVWDKSHNPMANGLSLAGHQSATQSAAILQHPDNPDQYYLFTLPAQAGVLGGVADLSFSIIDMNLNGGLGAVFIKNQSLLSNSTEKIAMIRHCNGKDVWVIGHEWNSNAFHAWHFGPGGLLGTKISTVGTIHNGSSMHTIGQMKTSPNGKFIAVTVGFKTDNDIELFSFNNSDGSVSSPINLPSVGGAYGVSFSPDNSKLYVSFSTISQDKILQYDLEAGGGQPDSIIGSKKTIHEAGMQAFGALQIGPDGKIYVARPGKNYLGVITKPNASGLDCAYVNDGFFLKGRKSRFGLPAFEESIWYTDIKTNFGYRPLGCSDFNFQFFEQTALLCNSNYKWYWNFGDGSVIDSSYNPTHQYPSAGKYDVSLVIKHQNGSDTITKNINVLRLRDVDFDFTQTCWGSLTNFTEQIPCNPVARYWDFDDQSPIDSSINPSHNYSKPGTYNVTLKAKWGDGFTKELTQAVIVYSNTGNAHFGYQIMCPNYVQFTDSSKGNPYAFLWDFDDGTPITAQKNPTHIYEKPGSYKVGMVALYQNSCSPDTTFVDLKIEQNWSVEFNRQSCLGTTTLYKPIFNGDTSSIDMVYWRFGDGEDTVMKTFPNSFSHKYKNAGHFENEILVFYNNNLCSEFLVEEVIIVDKDTAGILLAEDLICAGEPIDIKNVSTPTSKHFNWTFGDGAQTETKNPEYTYKKAGTYQIKLIVRGQCGNADTATTSIQVGALPNAEIDVIQDPCPNEALLFSANTSDSNEWHWKVRGITTKQASFTMRFPEPGTYPVELVVKNSYNCIDSSSMKIYISEGAKAYAGADTRILRGQSVMLNSGSADFDVLWEPQDLVDNPNAPSTTARPLESTTFILTTWTDDSCVAFDSVHVEVVDISNVAVPTAFTPNDDGFNDVFTPIITGDAHLIYFRVFNRWGEMIFETEQSGHGWDGTYRGTKQPLDSYMYSIVVSSASKGQETVTGAVTLVR